MDLLFKNGTLVFADGSYKADLAVTSGRITAIGENLTSESHTSVVDASDKLILPGGIDAHAHLKLADGPFGGTRAAACGGTTTVFDFAAQLHGEKILDRLNYHRNFCDSEVCIDYAIHMAVTDTSNGLISGMDDCVANGITSFKAYMVYDGWDLDDAAIFTMLERSVKIGALIEVHSESKALLDILTAKYLKEAPHSPFSHYLSRPEVVESEAVARVIRLAKAAGAPVYIAHLTTDDALESITKARDEGWPVFSETCPQYLHFTNDVYNRPDAINFVCSPSMKGEKSRQAIWRGLKRKDIDIVASDHSSYKQAEKDVAADDFTMIPMGCPGVETRYPYILAQANSGVMSFSRAVELCATNPAKIFGCDDRKGSLAIGKDADIVVYDPQLNLTVTNENMHGNNDQTIWEGMTLKGYPVETYCRGRLVFKDGIFVGEKGFGKFVPCNKIHLDGPFI